MSNLLTKSSHHDAIPLSCISYRTCIYHLYTQLCANSYNINLSQSSNSSIIRLAKLYNPLLYCIEILNNTINLPLWEFKQLDHRPHCAISIHSTITDTIFESLLSYFFLSDFKESSFKPLMLFTWHPIFVCSTILQNFSSTHNSLFLVYPCISCLFVNNFLTLVYFITLEPLILSNNPLCIQRFNLQIFCWY